jgi:hypothetical protein
MTPVAISVMNRIEKKYVIDTHTYTKLLKTIKRCTELDAYNKNTDFYTVSNLYYDTDDNDLIRLSLSKPEYKEKIRLRAYGVPTGWDTAYLEVKKKFGGVVNKRRAAFVLLDAYEFLETHVPQKQAEGQQIVKELTFALKRYSPAPKVYIAYDRRAYLGENGLRITFDTNLRTRRNDLRLEAGDHGKHLLEQGDWLMEIKAYGALPIWLSRLLSENSVFPCSFSKYGKEYTNFLMNGGAKQCLNLSLTRQQMPLKQMSAGKQFAL